MTPAELRAYCLGKAGAWPDEPWEGDTVAKIGPGERGKIFAFLGEQTLGVKSARTREEADEWLVRYPDDASVMAYIGRSGWNTLRIDRDIPDDEIRDAVDTSYDLVMAGLPKKFWPPASG
ncbi:MmcQ/YjbR family DNA-binding protein [Luteipulveratus mongoliensis]|uniref:MmcQ-like protein n=1 Tax=Luteipulveratus mongoliensis TaxID=571913 RepID=A0A0K1JL76_9MICO|nr:MmcQ/YjbR family DNA-binding protein [Luteipulveratus mongoliensis]AKU17479.1 hypothetical protein VV02_19245 [Luteipulveratus mongoliensis]